jgi:hypothetical protein
MHPEVSILAGLDTGLHRRLALLESPSASVMAASGMTFVLPDQVRRNIPPAAWSLPTRLVLCREMMSPPFCQTASDQKFSMSVDSVEAPLGRFPDDPERELLGDVGELRPSHVSSGRDGRIEHACW